ncbi:MAG TPA: hypothetical protein VI653_12190 [Steroidobacteraceae bacterium]
MGRELAAPLVSLATVGPAVAQIVAMSLVARGPAAQIVTTRGVAIPNNVDDGTSRVVAL